ncbi:cytochrome c oxidase subunit II [Moritella viscosa]|uniref:cytochrome c oxidase subunit II n=1 Tax=Moritella viscosa TaxID=80854 RepID=UPI000508F978|nr:cytochrome c oxidase subunit II [Moritella viscosa]CED61334.1 cytochrome c oxidase, subunit II [Moritella viscosa]
MDNFEGGYVRLFKLKKITNTFMLGIVSTPLFAQQSNINMTEGVTGISNTVYSLHMTILYICIAIALIVFGVMFWSLYSHRKSKGAVSASFHESTTVEIIWTAIPIVILIGMAIPSTQALILMEDTTEADITIQITGSQWKWHYRYFDHDLEFYSRLTTSQAEINNEIEKQPHYLQEVDNPLVLPTNKKIRFLITADDVIHSWWIPDFAVKKDANPGFINEAWTQIDTPGTYRGQCAELCGKDHGFMPIVVTALEPEVFDDWLAKAQVNAQQALQAEQQSLTTTMDMPAMMTLGEEVYNQTCAACHQVAGQGIPGAFPALQNSPIALGDVDKHISVVLQGVTGTAMASYAKQLTKKELAAVITYERNAWGNNTGDIVQPSQIDAALNSINQ